MLWTRVGGAVSAGVLARGVSGAVLTRGAGPGEEKASDGSGGLLARGGSGGVLTRGAGPGEEEASDGLGGLLARGGSGEEEGVRGWHSGGLFGPSMPGPRRATGNASSPRRWAGRHAVIVGREVSWMVYLHRSPKEPAIRWV
jgi:hypothetical protein